MCVYVYISWCRHVCLSCHFVWQKDRKAKPQQWIAQDNMVDKGSTVKYTEE